jgi:1,4-alpha-glucan branching enzyme
MATLRTLYTFMATHPGKKLLFMGAELGEWREWNHDDSLDWSLLDQPLHAGLHRFLRDLLRLYKAEPALYEVDFEPPGFEWIDCTDNESSVIAFLRRGRDSGDYVLAVLNWTPVVREDYRIGVPDPGYYREVLNSDSELYGGGNLGNSGGVLSEPVPSHGHPQSLSLTLPPLGALIFTPPRPGP